MSHLRTQLLLAAGLLTVAIVLPTDWLERSITH